MDMLLLLSLLTLFAVAQGAEYYGKEIGDLSTLHHEVSGTVYALDNKRLYIHGFSYDGAGPDAFFWVGERSKGVGRTPDDDGTKIPDEFGRGDVLKAYGNMNIVLTLPDDLTVSGIRWLSVWCREFSVDFGNVYISSTIDVPAVREIGEFVHRAHETYSGPITILDHRTIEIKELNMDILKGYDGSKTVKITLPKERTVFDIDWFSIYCLSAKQVFAYINIPDDLNVPALIEDKSMEGLANCQKLHDYLQVSWQIEGDMIVLDLIGSLLEREYMAFGLSGSDSSSSMIGADVFTAYYDYEGPKAVDYKLTAYAQCSNGHGVCPDVEMTGGEDNVDVISGTKEDGIVTIRMKRALDTGETLYDNKIHKDRELYVVWAIGALSDEDLVLKHSYRSSGDVKLDFGRSAMRECPSLKMREVVELDPWPAQTLDGGEITTFTASIGPTGGTRGYTAITGHPSWGIAWYINDLLIPEVTVRRGQTYTFTTNGGDDPSNPAKYHPFYITSDPAGGRAKKNTQEKMAETVFAGEETDGSLSPGAVGPYCEWNPKTVDKAAESDSFNEYIKTLAYTCPAQTPGGSLRWTPDDNTPDWVYYQCYTHRHLGWKIHVVNADGSYSTTPATTQGQDTGDGGVGANAASWILLLLAAAMCLAL